MKRSWIIMAGGLVLSTLALTACGSDEKEEEVTATATPAATTSALVDHADASALDLGQSAPDFSLTSSAGETVSLADYQGEPVLLFFHMADG